MMSLDHCCCSVAKSRPTLQPHRLQPTKVPLSMGFSRQEHWSGLPCPPPGDLPDPGIEPESLTSPTLAAGFLTTSATWESPLSIFQSFLKFIFIELVMLSNHLILCH